MTVLLSLKEEFKKMSGKEWNPTETASNTTQVSLSNLDFIFILILAILVISFIQQPKNDLYEKVKAQADLVRTVKANKAPKDEVTKQVALLLSLKEEYKKETGQEWKMLEETKAASSSPAPNPTVEVKLIQLNFFLNIILMS